LLLVTVNNKLILEIEIVHDLSCHPILYSVHMWYYIYTAVCISLCTNTSVL